MSTQARSFWLRPEPSTRQPGLSRAKIAAAALALADAEGFEQVTMRRVAKVLGAGTMSLYYYVKTRDELVALMDDALMTETLLPEPRSDWPGALLTIALRTRELFLRHAWALSALRTVPPGPNAMRHFEQCLHALSETQLTTDQKLTLLAQVDDLVVGNALRSGERFEDADVELARHVAASGDFPHLAALLKGKAPQLPEDRFERGLEALLAQFVSPVSKPRGGLGRKRP